MESTVQRFLKYKEAIFFLALFLLFLIPPTDPDLGWQLRCGEEFWKNHNFCQINKFSVLLANYFWPNHHWFYQTLLYPIYQFFGLWGLTLANAFLVTGTFAFFYFAIEKSYISKTLAILITIFVSWGIFSFGLRSQLTSLFLFSLLFWLLLKIKKNAKLTLLFPIIILFWTNLHGSFIIGLALLGFFLVKEGISSLSSPLFRFLLLSFILSLLATFTNPSGLKIYEEAWRHAGVVDLSKLIAEWAPPNEPLQLLIFLSALVLLFFLFLEEKKENKFLAFLILPFAFLAFQARRHIPLYLLTLFYLFLTASLTKKLLKSARENNNLNSFLLLVLSLSFFTFSLTVLPQTIKINSSRQDYCQLSSVGYPCQAVEFLKREAKKGNIFNRYEWGGFLIWQLPDFKVFVDGRMPAWPDPSGKSPYTIYLETLQTQPGWEETLKRYDIDFILISPGTFMDLLLENNPEQFGWRQIFRDKNSVIYGKK